MTINRNNWQVKTLGEITKISKGKKLNSLVDKRTSISKRFIQINDLRNSNRTKFTEDKTGIFVTEKDVLIAWDGANAGTVGFGLNGFIGSTIARLEILDENISPSYLGWFLKTKSKYLRDNCTGATIPHINKSVLVSLKMQLPPLPIQKQIAEILEKSDETKEKRKEANKLTDEFLQSVFIEMFSDPVKNPKGWKKVKAKYLYEIKLGKMRSEKKITGKYLKPYLRNINVQWGRINFSDIKEMDFNPKEQKVYALKKGDILVCEGGEVGRTAIWTGEITEIYYQNALHRLRAKSNNIDSLYFLYFMFFAAKYGLIIRQTSTVTIAHFTAAKFNEFEVMLPPITLQQQFAEIVNKTEALKEKQKQSEQELENLFQNLMQRAFKGELV